MESLADRFIFFLFSQEFTVVSMGFSSNFLQNLLGMKKRKVCADSRRKLVKFSAEVLLYVFTFQHFLWGFLSLMELFVLDVARLRQWLKHWSLSAGAGWRKLMMVSSSQSHSHYTIPHRTQNRADKRRADCINQCTTVHEQCSDPCMRPSALFPFHDVFKKHWLLL